MSVWTSLVKVTERLVMTTALSAIFIAPWATPGASQGSSPPPASAAASSEDVQALRERVAAFWAARLAGDSKVQWDLLEPRGRGRLTMQEYASDRGAVRYLAYQVEDATVTGYFAVVKVRLMLQPILPSARRVGVQTTIAEDRWVKIRGVWYRRFGEEESAPSQGGTS
jgi:hypothetical protein